MPRLSTRFPFFLVAMLCGDLNAAAQAVDADVYPNESWSRATAQSLHMQAPLLDAAREYALSGGGAGMITRGGEVVLSWGDSKRKFDLKSTSKSIGITALGLAIDDGKMSLPDLAIDHQPEFAVPPDANRRRGWIHKITLRHLANHTAGFEKPGGYEPLLFEPGTRWHYSDGGPNWLAECVTLAMQQDIETLMFQRVLTPIGITKNDLHWRPHQYRPKTLDEHRRCEFGSGVHANVDAMARLGLLYLRRGMWQGQRLLSAKFIDEISKPDTTLDGLREWDDQHGDASQHYGLLWWNNGDGAIDAVPKDAFWSWGLYDSLIVVIPSLDLVAARVGKSWKRDPNQNHYDVLKPFLQPIAAAVKQVPDTPRPTENLGGAPYPPSPVIASLTIKTVGRR